MVTETQRKPHQEYFAEVISSSNEVVIAQCYKELLFDKTFKNSIFQGAIVKISSQDDSSYEAFGIISKINNTSLDSIHKPSALGLTAKELEHYQPQIFELLRKELEIHLFAYKEEDRLCNYPPVKPLMIHDFVCIPTNKEVIQLTNDFSNVIELIKRNQLKPSILVSLADLGYSLRSKDNDYLIKVSKQISLFLNEEYDLLIQLLKRISALRQ